MTDDFLSRVYELSAPSAVDAHYSSWAATYDDEVRRNGYVTPRRCAEALAGFVSGHVPILDMGCGTGISGAALADAGFTDISGQEVNAEMLEVARATDIYRRLELVEPDEPFPFARGTYWAIAAIGVIGRGHAPASTVRDALTALAAGGFFVFSYNEHTDALSEFTSAIDTVVHSGLADEVFRENGPHFEGLGSHATVYVLRRRGD